MSINYGYQPIVTNGLVLHLDAANPNSYRSGSTAWNDLSGNRNNGTLVNGPGYNSANFGSITFDGVNDYVNIPPSNSLTFGSGNFSIDMFIRLNSMSSTPNNSPSIFGFFPYYTSANNFLMFIIGGRISLYNQSGYNEPIASITTGQDYHIALSRTSGVLSCYVNTSLRFSISYTTPIQSFTALNIMGDTQFGQDYTSGRVYSFKAYNRALSASEVQQNYNALKSRYGL